MKKIVVLTRKWPEAVEAALAQKYDVTLNESDQPFDAAKMRSTLASADAVLTTVTDKLDGSVFESNVIKAQIIGNYGVGYSHIDIEAAKANKVVVTNTPDVLSECTADLALTLMLMVTRRAGEGERQLRAGKWNGWRPTHMIGSRMTGKTLGIVGFGRIGRETAKRAHFGFGMPVIVFNRSKIDPEVLAETNATQVESIEALLSEADIVSLHCPGGDANTHLINVQRLALMKPTSFIINTARGEVIDEQALVNALQRNEIAGAGLDVFENEPTLSDGLAELENAVLLPHMGSSTRETRDQMGFRVIQNLDEYFANKKPGDQVA